MIAQFRKIKSRSHDHCWAVKVRGAHRPPQEDDATCQYIYNNTTIAVDNILHDNYPLYYKIITLQIKNCNVPKGNKTRDRKVL